MSGGSTISDYIPCVGVGKVGEYATLQSPGRNGAIVLTFIPTTATQSFSPTTALPTTAPPTYKLQSNPLQLSLSLLHQLFPLQLSQPLVIK